MNYKDISNDELKQIIKNSTTWEDICEKFNLQYIIIEFQRKLKRLNIDISHIKETYIDYNKKIKKEYLGHISDDKLKEIIKNAKKWNDVLRECNLNTLTRKIQRRIQNIDIDYSHLPKNYGGLFSKLSRNSKEFYIDLVKNSVSWDEILLKLKYKSSFYLETIKKFFDDYNINYRHLTYPKKISYKKKIELNEIFIKDSMYSNGEGLKKKLINELGWKHECLHCGKSTFCNKFFTDIQIPLELDHINGDHFDNRIENLRFLCPLCHSLTPTYCSNNINKTIEKQNRIDLINKKQEEILLLDNKIDKDENDIEKIELIKTELITIIQTKPKKEEVIKPNEKVEKKTNNCIDCNNIISSKSCRCNDCENKNRFITACKNTNRPSYEQLLQDIKEIKAFTKIGEKYNVSDNCIRKWIKKYEQYNEQLEQDNEIT
jgi:hypothetical protein